MKNKVAVISVNYNARQYLGEFIESVRSQDHTDIEIVLIDNASTDSSAAWLKENAPGVHLIEMPENVGYGVGCNIGMRYAIEELRAEYLLLLNNDTVLQPALVSELLKYTDESTVTTGRIDCGEKDAVLEPWYAGGDIDWTTAKINQVLYPRPEAEVYEVEFISGCCMMIHRDVIDKVGYFDSQFFLYYEDTDYCVRLRDAGISMKYITTAGLWHKVGGSSLGGSEASCSTQYYVTRNRLLFAGKYPGMFKDGNLSILRQLLEERAFFDGVENAKHRFYVSAAIADHLKGYYGKGHYGRALIEKGYYVANGFYEKEECGEEYWYWASERCATVYLANHRKQSGVYIVSFDLAPAVPGKKQMLEVVINGRNRAEYFMPGRVAFAVPIMGESALRLDLVFHGTEKTDMVDGNKRTLFYQMLNLRVVESDKKYCVLGKTYPEERDGNDFWQWSADKICKVYMVNRELQKKILVFGVLAESVDGQPYDLQIYLQGKFLTQIRTMKECRIPLELEANEISELELRCKAPIVSDFGRKLCFKLKNVTVQEADTELYWGECFFPEECGGGAAWRWSADKQGVIRLVNRTGEIKLKKISYMVIPYDAEDVERFSVYNNGTPIKSGVPNHEQTLIVKAMPQSVTEILIATEYKSFAENGRTICFRLQNPAVEDLAEEFVPDLNFYEIEEDASNKWCWSYEDQGTVRIFNMSDYFVWKYIRFDVFPFKQGLPGEVHIHENGVDVTERCVRDGHIRMVAGLPPRETLEVGIATSWPVAGDGERNMCFCVSDLAAEDFQEDIFWGSAFGEPERDGNNSWTWCREASGSMTVINRRDASALCLLELEVLAFDGTETFPEGKIVVGEVTEKLEFGKRKSFFLELGPHECVSVTFDTPLPVHELDSQKYCFQVRNIRLDILQAGLYFDDTFYMKETDGINCWRWCIGNCGRIYIVSAGGEDMRKTLEFELFALESQEEAYEIWHRNKQLSRGACGKHSVQIECKAGKIEEVTILCHAEMKRVDGRVLCFGIRNVVMRDAEE